MRRFSVWLVGFMSLWGSLSAQVDTAGTTFTLDDFLAGLRDYHPLLQQADLLPSEARMALRSARGTFDPVLVGDIDQKNFDDKAYYDNFDGYVKVPTLPGLDLKAGYERNEGEFLNPENNTPGAGLWYAGLSVPVTRLVMDERRLILRQAQLLPEMAEARRTKVVNKALLTALKAYFDWQAAWYINAYREEGLNLAEFRFRGVTERAKAGDLAPIDTVEAELEVQKRRALYQEAFLDREVARQELQKHLWQSGRQPAALPADAKPSALRTLPPTDSSFAIGILAHADTAHPRLLKLRLKRQSLLYERRYHSWQLLPDIRLDYNALIQPGTENTTYDMPYFRNNYKFGAGFYFPLFTRKTRGKLQQTGIKLDMLDWETAQLRQSIRQNVLQELTRARQFGRLWDTQRRAVTNAERLREGEQIMFENGESSLFLVNRRERSLVDARVKLVELQAKYYKARAAAREAAGLSPSDW